VQSLLSMAFKEIRGSGVDLSRLPRLAVGPAVEGSAVSLSAAANLMVEKRPVIHRLK
jgi:hypothetical protein